MSSPAQEPLLAPGPALTADERRRRARHLLLPEIGETGRRRLENARDRPLLRHCASGNRSARARRALLAAGDADVRHLDGGLSAWLRASGPVVAGDPLSA